MIDKLYSLTFLYLFSRPAQPASRWVYSHLLSLLDFNPSLTINTVTGGIRKFMNLKHPSSQQLINHPGSLGGEYILIPVSFYLS